MAFPRPSDRGEFEIAIICALPLEYDAAALIFDEFWDHEGDPYGTAPGDFNVYTTGRVGSHNVVLTLLSHMGKRNAASLAASLRCSYTNLQIALLVGICGGVPSSEEAGEIYLGDIIISRRVMQYDFGRQYPDKFMTKDAAEDGLGPPNKIFHGLLATLKTERGLSQFIRRTDQILQEVQAKVAHTERHGNYDYLGENQDKLYEPTYRHRHYGLSNCLCRDCFSDSDPVCETALDLTCDDLGCNDKYLVMRQGFRSTSPHVHLGTVASGDAVIRSASHRDEIAKNTKAIAFEMEGAGVWDEIPCIIIKGVCDYADSHKHKRWQKFAAANAASASKAFLAYIPRDKSAKQETTKLDQSRVHCLLPFGRNEGFVGREDIIKRLIDRISPTSMKDTCQKTVLEGLGGIGKTQISLEAAFRVREKHPNCSIFWVAAVDSTTFRNAYLEIGRLLKVPSIDTDQADVNSLVQMALSNEESGHWLLIIDNADDVELLFGSNGLLKHLPSSSKGSILVTTRNHEVSTRLDVHRRGIFSIPRMEDEEAKEMLQMKLSPIQVDNADSTTQVIKFLDNLPLAIKQAASYMDKTRISTQKYLHYCQSSNTKLIKLLSRDFEDCGRYDNVKNPIATTWLISFDYISRDCPLAGEYLKFLCFLSEKDIPRDVLPQCEDEMDRDEAIGVLKSYTFISEQKTAGFFAIHRLVRLAMRNLLFENGFAQEIYASVVEQLKRVFPFPSYENQQIWIKYLPHVQSVLNCEEQHQESKSFRDILHNFAYAFYLLGKYEECTQYSHRTIKLSRLLSGNDHPNTLSSMNNLALTVEAQGNYQEAEEIYRQILELDKKSLPQEHPDTFVSMDNLGRVLQTQKKYQEAEEMLLRVLELRKKILGHEHPDTLTSMNNLAVVLHHLEKVQEAVEIHSQVFQLRKKISGPEHPYTLTSFSNLSIALQKQGKYQEAEAMLLQVLELRKKILGQEHSHTITSMNDLAIVLNRLGKVQKAAEIHSQVLQLRKKVLGQKHPNTIDSMDHLADTLWELGKHEEAERLNRQTIELSTIVLGRNHRDTISSMRTLAHGLNTEGKSQEAQQIFQEIRETEIKQPGKDGPDKIELVGNLESVCQ